MNREAMVEAGARGLAGADADNAKAFWDGLSERTRLLYRSESSAVLDAVLPQITNVEQIHALPEYTILMSDDGDGIPRFYFWVNNELCDLDSQDATLMEPHDLTDGGSLVQVVWTP